MIAVDQFGDGLLRAQRAGCAGWPPRVDDLGALTDEMGIEGPVVTVAHDWGGPISLGWGSVTARSWLGVVLLKPR